MDLVCKIVCVDGGVTLELIEIAGSKDVTRIDNRENRERENRRV
jgi:hypothetical protein